MHTILGATGHVGSAVARSLLDRGEQVTVLTRDPRRAEPLARLGASVAAVDVRDAGSLRDVLRRGTRAFLMMPLADPAGDTVAEERRTVAAIVRAVEGARSHLEKVVVLSTYGAQPGEGKGDLGVLHELEQAIQALGVPASVVRGAYFMSNWDPALETARGEGVVHTLFPPALAIPMVAPADVGRAAARLLTDELGHSGIRSVEGPAPCSAADVAHAFAAALGRDVAAVETPRSQWAEAFQSLGFSPVAAASYTAMTAITIDGFERPAAPVRGATTLAEYVAALARNERDAP